MTAPAKITTAEPVELTPFAMADCIASGLAGSALTRALHHHFPAATRADCYLAIGLAVAILEADLTAAEIELQAMRNGRAAA